MSSGGGAYLVATQKTLSLELGTPRRLRQFFTTVILNPAAINMGLMVVCQTGLALLVQKLCVFSITNASGSSLHAILAQATATWARMSPCLCSPALEKHWQGGDAQMTSSPVGAELQMRSTSVGWSRSALINGESKLMVWYFCTELQMSTLRAIFHPHRLAATFHPPAPEHRSSTLTCPSLADARVCAAGSDCEAFFLVLRWGRWKSVVGTCRVLAPSPGCTVFLPRVCPRGAVCSAA